MQENSTNKSIKLEQSVKCSPQYAVKPTWELCYGFYYGFDGIPNVDQWVLEKLKDGADPNAVWIQKRGSVTQQDAGIIFGGILQYHLKESFEYALNKGVNLNDPAIQNNVSSYVFFTGLNDKDCLYFARRLLENGLNPKTEGCIAYYFEGEVTHACGQVRVCLEENKQTNATLEDVQCTEKALKTAQQLWNMDINELQTEAQKAPEQIWKAQMLMEVANLRQKQSCVQEVAKHESAIRTVVDLSNEQERLRS